MSLKTISLVLAFLLPCLLSCEKKDKTVTDVKSLQSLPTSSLESKSVAYTTLASTASTTDKGWSTSVPINTNGNTIRPILVSDGSGNIIAVWNTADDIFACSFDWKTGWSSPVLLGATKRAGPELTHHVSMNKNGDAVAVWIQNITGAGFRIYASKYAKATGWTKGVPIDNGNGNVDDPFVATNENGNTIAIWVQSDGKTSNVWSNRYNVNKGWGTASQVYSNSGRPFFPKVAIDNDGNAVAIWMHYLKKGATNANIWASRFATDKGWENASPIDNKTGHAYLPNIVMDEKGDATAIWVQSNRKFDAIFANQWMVGKGWSNAKQIENNPVSISTEDPHPRPYMALDNKGNPTVIWYQCDENGGGSIWINRFLPGTGWTEPTLISNSSIDGPAEPRIAFDADGSAIAVWEQQDHGIWSARFIPNGGWHRWRRSVLMSDHFTLKSLSILPAMHYSFGRSIP